ncbi:hypothetical protein PWYN_11890 [Paenibacillus wynnii]|uniref:Uncharacterized protein n=1 Tax=Paenibacillus wynnii TaxID=268407 RepID=A0A098MD26_9BACL|nr:hypothetical protein PWYN_11890 [Paenibacillus wynnii]
MLFSPSQTLPLGRAPRAPPSGHPEFSVEQGSARTEVSTGEGIGSYRVPLTGTTLRTLHTYILTYLHTNAKALCASTIAALPVGIANYFKGIATTSSQ